MKKFISLLIVLLLLPSLLSVEGQAYSSFLYNSRLEYGIIGITYPTEEGIRYKVAISKGSETYYYDYTGPETELYPLQLGNGEYTVSLLRNVSGNKYIVVGKETVQLNLEDENVVYLQSVQNVRFDAGMGPVLKAEELTRGLENTSDKVEAIYRYIVSNIKYNYNFDYNLDNQYIPNTEDTFITRTGICYDFASLFAAMLRSQGIPAKLVKGYSVNVEGYHAWNEVLIDGNWVVIDTAYDATAGKTVKNMIKQRSEYQPEKFY